MINWVVALKSEADCIIQNFNLKKDNSKSPFPVFFNKENFHYLIISGVGKLNSSAATSWLASKLYQESITEESLRKFGWVNFGISGSYNDNLGEFFLVNKITDISSKRVWYPRKLKFLNISSINRREIHTVDYPKSNYPKNNILIDMESSGFFSTINQISSIEFCQLIKVISDNKDNYVSNINKTRVNKICSNALENIQSWINSFENLLKKESIIYELPSEFYKLINIVKFSETQKHQLKRIFFNLLSLSNYKKSIGIEYDIYFNIDYYKGKSSRYVISSLKSKLDCFRKI